MAAEEVRFKPARTVSAVVAASSTQIVNQRLWLPQLPVYHVHRQGLVVA